MGIAGRNSCTKAPLQTRQLCACRASPPVSFCTTAVLSSSHLHFCAPALADLPRALHAPSHRKPQLDMPSPLVRASCHVPDGRCLLCPSLGASHPLSWIPVPSKTASPSFAVYTPVVVKLPSWDRDERLARCLAHTEDSPSGSCALVLPLVLDGRFLEDDHRLLFLFTSRNSKPRVPFMVEPGRPQRTCVSPSLCAFD